MTLQRHGSGWFSLDLPKGWEAHEDVQSIALLALEPPGLHPSFRANVAVTVEQVAEGSEADRFTDESLEAQGRMLQSFRLIDRAPATLAGGAATRTLGHHDLGGIAVVVDQWRLVHGRRGYGLTASCWALDYDELADRFVALAETLAPRDEGG